MANTSETMSLLERVGAGDNEALGVLLDRDRQRLLRIVEFRMERVLRARVDPADVLQEACLDATRRVAEYVRNPKLSFFLWLRFLTLQKLAELRRRHLGAQARDAHREISLFTGPLPRATSAALAAQLLGKQTSPSQAAIREETRRRLEETLNALPPLDREILALRHFEQLSNAEVARVLDIQLSAASSRYVRALKRLKEVWQYAT
ncbi:MAG: sigma-70 family RNA polymerase sigma factor [Pirellulaceae bacterium]|jgi:RNA polymerase sigma-70 factor (ECF subfamily)|nr:sigma-70 family RNA polymerase sigma factor [Pirellulaceae bacterium]